MMTDTNSISLKDRYKIALQTRNLELRMYWQRSNYFLVLNTAIAVGYFSGKGDYIALLAIVGFLVSVLWLCITLGSKYWQSRWEHRLRKVEEEFSEEFQFFKTTRHVCDADAWESLRSNQHGSIRTAFDHLVMTKPSVTYMMMLLSLVFILFWIILMISSSFDLLTPLLGTTDARTLMQVLCVLFALGGSWCLAFGLMTKPGMSSEMDKALPPKEGLYTPSQVRQRHSIIWIGLGLITIAAIVQVYLLLA